MEKDTASIDPVTVIDDTSIKPFRVDFHPEAIDDLRRRIEMTRWASKELVPDGSQGVQEEMLQELARYWADEYDLGRVAERLNALPQFTTEIDGLRIHFIHVKSKHEDALPLIMTHGWPGSVIEMLETIGPLTDPTAYGGDASDAFDLVLPSLPGFGFSGQPTELGWDPGRTAHAWAVLMNRLGYSRYVAQGGDIGANVTDSMARQAPDGLLGIHLNFLASYPLDVSAAIFGGLLPAGLFKRVGIAVISHHAEKKEPVALDELAALFRRGYFVEMPEHPQTIGSALTDTPVGLAAWMLDHDTDSYEKIAHAFLDVRRDRGRSEATQAEAPRGLHRVPRRDRPDTAGVGEEGVPKPHVLQRGGQGRPLRGVGGAPALLGGASGRLQVASMTPCGCRGGDAYRSVDQATRSRSTQRSQKGVTRCRSQIV
jgi:pimeloyl-ACP methyl ester carboxylesterase